MTSGTINDLNAVWGTSGNDVFAVGDAGTILHYNGMAWSTITINTTTTSTTTSTTTTSVPRCPAVKLYGDGSPEVENMRDFRDSTLAQTAIGRRAIEIYYTNADSINAVLDRSPALCAVTRRVLEIIAPMVGKNSN